MSLQIVERWIRRNLFVLLLGCFLVIEALSIGLLQEAQVAQFEGTEYGVWGAEESIPRLSDVREPSIDTRAAWVETRETPIETLPTRLWVFLLIAYVALLVFNLAYDFERATRVQWSWELMLTAMAFLAWYVWDTSGATLWFPLAVLKMGVLVYAIYLFLFDRKMLRREWEAESVILE